MKPIADMTQPAIRVTSLTAFSPAECCILPEGSVTPGSRERTFGKTGDLGLRLPRRRKRDREVCAGNVQSRRSASRSKLNGAPPIPLSANSGTPSITPPGPPCSSAAALSSAARLPSSAPVTFCFLKLPSGRKLAYPFARPKLLDPQHGAVVFADNSDGQFRECRNGAGVYGGVWTENIVSGIARDLLAEAMLRIETRRLPDRVACA